MMSLDLKKWKDLLWRGKNELLMQNTVTLDDAMSFAVCLTSFGLVSV